MHHPFIRMELKYCERCGGLWLRPCGAGACCPPCAEQLQHAETILRPGRPRRGRPPLSACTINPERSA